MRAELGRAGRQVGRCRLFIDGRRWGGSPGNVRLARHSEIVLEVGPYVRPHTF